MSGAPLCPVADPYLRFEDGERERLIAVSSCRCGERATVGADGACSKCGRVRAWWRWLAEA